MTGSPDIDWQREQASKIAGVEWDGKKRTKGILRIDGGVLVEFNFDGVPSFKIQPKEARERLPNPIDLIPALVLWDEDAHPSWAEVLQELKAKIAAASGAVSGSWMPAIERKLLLGLLDAARRGHPNESFFLLKKGPTGVLDQVVLPQGTKGGKVMAIFSSDRLPYDKAIEATFHSHPSGNGTPSEPDLKAFVKYKVNIIAHAPYGEHDFKAFTNKGNPIDLEVRD
jgi:proteasome lid subunit RPN8/RPN11